MNNKTIQLRAFVMAVGLASTLTAVAHDAVVPCWRGQEGATFQEWDFLTSANPASATAYVNPYASGSPQATVTLNDGYYATWEGSTNVGWWGLLPSGTIAMTISNRPSAPAASCKYVWVQVAQYIGGVLPNYCNVAIPGATYLGGQRVTSEVILPFGSLVVDQTLWRLEPNPSSETVTVIAPSTGALIDHVLIDTICITNANTYVDDNYTGSDCDNKGWPDAVSPIDKPLNLLAFASFQTGVDRAPTNGFVNVAAGSYPAVNVNKAVTVKLAPTTGQATVAGLTLGSTATLAMDINGTNVGSQYDQWLVNGGVTLGNAALSTSYTAGSNVALNTQFILIANDAADAVSGTFAGLPEGATNAGLFKISYVGGTGNDVVLTLVNHAPIPGTKIATTYVNLPATNGAPKLVGAATDPDGDPVSFVGPVSPSAQGGSVTSTTVGGAPAIVYTPPLNFIGTDLVYYTITDGKALSTGTITVTVLPDTGVTFNMMPLIISNNLPLVRFLGVPGLSYTLQRSPDLTNWTSIYSTVLPGGGNGIGTYYDSLAPSTNAFYRARRP
jgi:hypothetical protein